MPRDSQRERYTISTSCPLRRMGVPWYNTPELGDIALQEGARGGGTKKIARIMCSTAACDLYGM